jgi:glycosyltransferase involved in cell wall biosynthesis
LKRTKLILLTAGFPFGGHETFLETEIKYLCEGFEQVQILAVDPESESMRSVPENCSVTALHTRKGVQQKLKALAGIYDPRVGQELKIIRSVYGLKLNKGILSTLLVSLQRAKDLEQQIIPFIEKESETVLYSYWCDDSALALSLLSEKRKDLKTVCRIHRWDVYFDQSAVGYLPFRHYITTHLNTIFSISQDGIDHAKRVWKTGKDEKFQLSRLGINNEFPLRQVERDYLLLVSCSNLIPVKRVHLLAEALQHMTSEKIHWVHIGDGPERERIEDLIKHFPSNVSAELKGRIPNSAIYTYYDETRPDLFVNVSASEGVPVSIMEAMSFGIPVLATDVGGNGEIVNEGNGLLIPSNSDSKNIKNILTTFLALNQNAVKIDAYKTWEQKYQASLNYQLFVDQIVRSSKNYEL